MWQWRLVLIWCSKFHVTMIDNSSRLDSGLDLSFDNEGLFSNDGVNLTWQWWKTLLGWTGSFTWQWGPVLIWWSESHLTMMEDSVRQDWIFHLTMKACYHTTEWIWLVNEKRTLLGWSAYFTWQWGLVSHTMDWISGKWSITSTMKLFNAPHLLTWKS